MARIFISYATPDRAIADAEARVEYPLIQDRQYEDYQADPQKARDRMRQAMRLLDDGSRHLAGGRQSTAALSHVFFGRATEDREGDNRRLRTMNGTGGKLVIAGTLGCGKSSLLLNTTGARSSTGNGIADGVVLAPIDREILRDVIEHPAPMLPDLRQLGASNTGERRQGDKREFGV